jgi:hypothetical protein
MTAVPAAQDLTPKVTRAATLQAQASDFNARGRPAVAARLLRSAFRELDIDLDRDVDWRALDVTAGAVAIECLISLALAEAELGGFERGWSRLATARDAVDALDAHGLRAVLANQAAVLLLRVGRDDEALVELHAAQQWLAQAPPAMRCRVLGNRGLLLMMRGDIKRARRDLAASVEIARAIEDPVLENKSLHNLGYVEFIAGNLALALKLMDDAAQLATGVIDGVALLDKARVLIEAGLVRAADQVLAEAARALAADRLMQDVGEVETARAECALVLGDVESARRLAARARDRFRRRGNERWRRNADLVLLQADLAAGRPGSRLYSGAQRLADGFAADGLQQRARTAQLLAAEALLQAGRADAARAVTQELGRAARADPITVRLHARYVAARAALGGRATAPARRQIEAGLAELAAYQATFGSIDLRSASALHGKRLAELGVSIALRSGDAARVLDAAERGRSVSSRIPPVQPPADDRIAELLAELRQVVEASREASVDRDATAQLTAQRRRMERLVSERRWSVQGDGGSSPIAPLDEIGSAVEGSRSTMVMYLEAEGALHAIVLSARGLRLTGLGPLATIEEQIRRAHADLDVLAHPLLPGVLATAVRSSLRRSLQFLEAALVQPLAVEGPLVVVTTGLLGQLAWGALPSLRGVPITVAPSATSWCAATAQSVAGAPVSTVALAGPGLNRADHEVAGVGKAWSDGRTIGHAEATCNALSDALSTATVVHIAAHGVHQTDSPLFSSLRLADGVFFAHELDSAVRTPEHVILSACELGRASVRPGDEALGLTSVLLRLGSRSVISSVARVNDEVAADVMIDYHSRLSRGSDAATALAEATADGDLVAPFACFGANWSRGDSLGA